MAVGEMSMPGGGIAFTGSSPSAVRSGAPLSLGRMTRLVGQRMIAAHAAACSDRASTNTKRFAISVTIAALR